MYANYTIEHIVCILYAKMVFSMMCIFNYCFMGSYKIGKLALKMLLG